MVGGCGAIGAPELNSQPPLEKKGGREEKGDKGMEGRRGGGGGREEGGEEGKIRAREKLSLKVPKPG